MSKIEYGKYTIESESYEYQEPACEGTECKRSGPTITKTFHAVMFGTFIHGEFPTLQEAKKWIDMRPSVKPHNDNIEAQIKAVNAKRGAVLKKIRKLEKDARALMDLSDTLAGKLL